ncbi:MAG: polysaccharide deacetylase family protein [Oscillospiraceae bacterium]|nr:polysaccharide deacetylase family protein [Oscillospiraceae bacterium]
MKKLALILVLLLVFATPAAAQGSVALTFDDGPSKVTTQIMAALEDVDGRGTFFVLGNRCADYPKILRRMVRRGHEIGGHSWGHARLTGLGSAALAQDIARTTQAIEQHSGHAPTLLRPPFGAINQQLRNQADVPIIHWSVDTHDWQFCDQLCPRRDASQCAREVDKLVNDVLENLQDGDIILMHDIFDFTQQAALRLIEKLHEGGWQMVTVSELFAQRGITLQPGEVYYHARTV